MAKVLAALAAALLVGCAASQWQKPGADTAALDEDMRQCEQQASAYARQNSGLGDKPSVTVSPRGAVGVTRLPQAAQPIDPVVQDDFFRSCMRKKGYRQDSAL